MQLFTALAVAIHWMTVSTLTCWLLTALAEFSTLVDSHFECLAAAMTDSACWLQYHSWYWLSACLTFICYHCQLLNLLWMNLIAAFDRNKVLPVNVGQCSHADLCSACTHSMYWPNAVNTFQHAHLAVPATDMIELESCSNMECQQILSPWQYLLATLLTVTVKLNAQTHAGTFLHTWVRDTEMLPAEWLCSESWTIATFATTSKSGCSVVNTSNMLSCFSWPTDHLQFYVPP